VKRYGNLYKDICNLDNIILAHKNARRGKSSYREVIYVDNHHDECMAKIKDMLETKTYANSEYEVFSRVFGAKTRQIYKLPYFPDRIIHHCIMQVLEPIWGRVFIRDTYSSIKGRGIHDGLHRVKEALRNNDDMMCLKMDVKKFYPSIDHAILKRQLRYKIKCNDTLGLLDLIIDSADGVPIGNYLSQYFGNLYLTGMDHWIKETLKCKNYFRYCDDLVILDKSGDMLHAYREQIEKYLRDELNLTLKGNWQVFSVKTRGIDFLGYRIFKDYCLVRKSIIKEFKRKNCCGKENKNSIMSYAGWFKFADTFNFQTIYMRREYENRTKRGGSAKSITIKREMANCV